MLLTKLDIQGTLSQKTDDYLTTTEFTFSTLKNHLLNKAPIPQIHSTMVFLITQAQDADKVEVQSTLEKSAYNEELAVDEQAEQREKSEASKDEESKARMTRELTHIPTEIESFESECAELRLKLARLESGKRHHPSENTATIERLIATITVKEFKIQKLHQKKRSTQNELQKIESRAEVRIQNHVQRYKREQARITYKTSGTGLLETLSKQNRSLLLHSIQRQHDELEKKCAHLIAQAEEINYSFFLEQLTLHVQKMKLPPHDLLALNHVLKYIKQHLNYEKEIAATQNGLNKKRAVIKSHLERLQKLQAQLETLQASTPHLTTQNETLATQNKQLTHLQLENSNYSRELSTPALLLFAITLMSTIPLILKLSGVITVSIPLLTSLLVVMPVLLLATTVCLTVASLIYHFKANSNEALIKKHMLTIEDNKRQMEKNSKNHHNLQTLTIPNLEAQIKKEETDRDNLLNSLKQSQDLSQQSFRNALAIEPILQSQSPVIQRERSPSPTPPLVNSDSDEEDNSSEEESEDHHLVTHS